MKIRLNEIPQEGRQYNYDRTSGELNEILFDLLGEHDYSVDFFIKPIGNAYELRGKLKATVNETCSRCGDDFELPIERSINEVLFEDQTEYRKSHSVHGNQSVDFDQQGPSMTPIRGDVFEAGEFVHEMVALGEPFYPVCGPNETCLRSEEVSETLRRLDQEADLGEEQKPNPFSILKDLELTTSRKT